ncbi:TonB-dependent receptor [Methylobacterium sp. Leaf456]|uniref:TonB-dependent siderophore receptor n=1 Tax=Methylobacterium sp. Leaf456 TaxID=1736382 RepID=UPI0006FF45FF|nr:TonB-dependent siderophore receptor [Methylobacterium sp. Leaf456]KQT47876.1 TonB-dependent receptor [Methylobacterium sp. Leaf456]
MFRSARAAPLLALGTLLAASGAGAQDGDNPVVTLDELSVAGDGKPISRGYQPVRSSVATITETPLIKVPQAVAVVTEQVLQDQAVRSLDEALVNVSGITQTNTLGGTQDAFIRRGFGDNRDGSILRDGLRTALPRAFMPTTQRVEVLKGPASALYGILDPGGLINIVTKKPRFTQAGYLEVFGTSFNGGGVEMDQSGPVEGTNLAYRFIAQHRNQEYWRNFGMQSQQVIAPSVTWEGDDTRVTLAYEWSHYRTPFDRGTVFDPFTRKAVAIPRGRRLDEPWSVTAGESHVASLSVERRFSESWKASLNYAFSHNFYQDDQSRRVKYDPATGDLTRRSDATQDSNFTVHSGRLDIVGQETLFGVPHEILVGASYDESNVVRSRIIRDSNRTLFDVFNPAYGRTQTSTSVFDSDSNQREHIATASVYAQDSISLTEQFIVTGGLRYQSFDQVAGRGVLGPLAGTNYNPAIDTNVDFRRNTDVSGGRAVPRVGLVYLLTPTLSLYGSYSETFRPNASISSPIGALPPEQGDAFEIGLKTELFDGITATAALYDIMKSNVLYTSTSGGETVTNVAGRVRSRGFELDVAGQIAEGWSLIATYAYTDAKVVADTDTSLIGNGLANVAPHTASLFLTHDFGIVLGPFGEGRLRAGLGGRYVGVRPGNATNIFSSDDYGTFPGPTTVPFFLPDYAVADAFLAYDTQVAGRPTTLQLNLRNLTDTTYYASSIGTNSLNVAVGEPFQAIVTGRVFW